MKFKHLSFALLIAGAFSLAACSDDAPIGSTEGTTPEVYDGDGVFMTVNFAPVSNGGSRSYTDDENSSDHGVETGTEIENNINRVLLVLYSVDNKFIACATVEKTKMSISTDKTIYQANAKFNKTDIAQFYDNVSVDETTNPMVNVIVIANPTDALVTSTKALEPKDDMSDWMNGVYELPTNTDATIWSGLTNGSFIMSNVSKATRLFPASMNAWNLYSTEANAFDLSGLNHGGTDNEVDNQGSGRGAINVHRMAARFDFRDGSQMTAEDVLYAGQAWNGNGVKGSPFTYAVMTTTIDGESKDLIEATIVNMSLVNLLKQEYFLERVSANGMNAGANILGAELPWFSDNTGVITKTGNYVVTPFADKKNDALTTGFGNYFYYPFFDNNGKVNTRGTQWFSTRVADIVNPANKATYPLDATEKYNRWRYVTENTLPTNAANQANGRSTGIVFKAILKSGEALKASTDKWDTALANALDNRSSNGPILYLFSGKLYCGWDHVVEAALSAAGFDPEKGQDQLLDRTPAIFKAVFGKGGVGVIRDKDKNIILDDSKPDVEGNTYDEDPDSPNALYGAWNGGDTQNNVAWNKFRDAVVNATFTIYEKYQDNVDGWGYYCYYYYWNRHNDNYDNGTMAPMEFAVVRNNIYKIAVIRLSTLGHPRIPENDPDTPDPNTPDEKSDLYMTVSVQVIPWEVRFNNIVF